MSDFNDENCIIYVQTNNIKKAQINVDKYFINLMIYFTCFLIDYSANEIYSIDHYQ